MSMKVPLLDPCRANVDIAQELRATFDRVLTSGKYILGAEVEQFEAQCAAYLHVKHAIGVSSGTDALLMALMAFDIGPGDEVICPTYTFFATAGSVWRTGARPVFVDSRERCMNLDPDEVARALTAKTKAIMPVHLFGQAAEMEPLLALAKQKGLAIVEDAAQAIGAEYRGQRVGGLGTVGCFSFFPSKNLGGFGDAGLMTTNDDALAERLRALRTHGGKNRYAHDTVGGNFRIDALQAALLGVKLKKLDDYTSKRQRNAARYTAMLLEAQIGAVVGCGKGCTSSCAASSKESGARIFLPQACQSRHVYNQYVVRVPGEGRRDQLKDFLGKRGIDTAVYYPLPLHLQKCFTTLGHKSGDRPVAEALARETLALPIYAELGEDELTYVAESIIAFLRS